MGGTALGSALAVAQARAILRGVFPTFGSLSQDCGFPPDWRAFLPPAGPDVRAGGMDHWTQIDLERLPADVKLVWELSRFGWVHPLARAYARTADPRYPRACMTLIDSWMDDNPPNCGVHWTSAQEVGFRLLAAAFSLQAFAGWFDETPEAAERVVRLILMHARRIPPTIHYALAQGNNHLLLEATALLTAGLLFPELREAARWEKLGRGWLERGLRSQFLADGGYVQFSSNYHRLALECGLWAASVCRAAGKPLSVESLQALERGADCLQALVDASTGQASNLGPNDGALLLRLTDCVAEDYRPTLQLAWMVLHGERLYPPGPWDEAAGWLSSGGDGSRLAGNGRRRAAGTRAAPATDALLPAKKDFPNAGLFRLEGAHSWALLRCATFRTRPAHSDQLHFDLWWRGNALAGDGGTYLYTAAPPWDNGLAWAARHNTVVIDGQEPMLRAGRFLWLRWAQGRKVGKWRSPDGVAQLLIAEHAGYRRLGVTHRRAVLHVTPDHWWVVDDLVGQGAHDVRLTWRLLDGPWRPAGNGVRLSATAGQLSVQLEGAIGSWSLHRAGRRVMGEADDEPTRGWESPTYSRLSPGVELVVRASGPLPLRLMTCFDLSRAGQEPPRISWREIGAFPPIASIERGRFRWEP